MSSPDESWLKKAEMLKGEGRFEESLKAFDKAYEMTKITKKSGYWFLRGKSFSELGKYEDAVACFDKDVTTNGPTFQTIFEKAVVLFLSKKYSEAMENFNKAYETYHEEFLKHQDQAGILKEHKKFEKALIHSDVAINIQPITPKFWHLKGSTLFGMGKFKEALQCYNESQLKEDDPELLYDLAKCQFMVGNIDESLKTLENACRLDSGIRKALSADPVFEKLHDDIRFRCIRDYEIINP